MYFLASAAILIALCTNAHSDVAASENPPGDDYRLGTDSWSEIDFFITDQNNINVTSIVLGAPLTLRLSLSGTAYSALQPYQCYFVDGYDQNKKLSFVSNRCPQANPPVAGEMQRISEVSFIMPFMAFSFTPAPVSQLDVFCQITLCIEQNVDQFCNNSCWISTDDENYRSFYGSRSSAGDKQLAFGNKLGGILQRDDTYQTATLIITDLNYTTMSSLVTPVPNSSILYVMYGVAAFFAFLFFVLLTGIIVFLCCFSSKGDERNRVPRYAMPANMVPPNAVDPVFSNLPGQAPYCDWYTVFRIPRIFTYRSKAQGSAGNNANAEAGTGAAGGQESNSNDSPSTGTRSTMVLIADRRIKKASVPPVPLQAKMK